MTVGDEVWAEWLADACSLNEHAPPVRTLTGAAGGEPAGADAPGSDFNRRGSWEEAGLFEAGWAVARPTGPDAGLLTRPGKDGGVSASAGTVTSTGNGWPLFYCWSTSVPEFAPDTPYTRFGVYARLRHGGDHAAAARELRQRGYGSAPAEVTVPATAGGGGSAPAEVTVPATAGGGGSAPADGPAGAADPDRLFRWMSELAARPESDKWLWHGYVSRGGVTLLSALWKAGKSTLLSHLLKGFDGRQTEFCGRAIVPARVLYVSEEDESIWAGRRDALLIGDHVGMVCRPFRGRPSPAQWAEFLGRVVAAVRDHRFDLVVFDTLSKLWPVREENDAGQVEDALMPVWNITNTGAGLLMVHHVRKSDGGQFTGARGSGGLPAFCETLVELRRASGPAEGDRTRKRLLTAAGRFQETPAEWLIELDPTGSRFVSHGDPADQAKVVSVSPHRDWREWLHECVPEGLPGATVPEIGQAVAGRREGTGVRREDLLAALNAKVEGGEFQAFGLGTKGSPLRYSRITLEGPDPTTGHG